nr:PREDICTED: protein phosphatase 1 regulatory subunit 37 [Latimeria chalumnae]|eukprot:XP_014347932.1 PREDICTED: protein phosphatase 1 regulatory subunit 37 [Latimeria chalumnae]
MDGQTAGGAGREEEGGQETAGGSLFHWESRSKQEGEPSAAGGALEKGEPSPPLPEGNGKHKHGAKRVTFPSDEDIVSGAVEPKNPWRHAQNVTVEEILAAYRQTCQKLNCKPMTKLLKQIQEFKDLTQRIDCLDLKGEKLDYKACEALEEVFKRVQFKVVDLEQTNLDEDGASALFDMIEYYESATQLNISFNKHIGTRGWQAAAHMMRKNMNLRELYLAENKLNGLQDSAQLGNLLKFNCYIQILDLRNNNILDSGLAYICEGLKEQRKGLVTLVLWNNQLTHVGMAYLGVTLPHTQSLETLNLGHNPISNEGVRHLKNGLIANRSVLRLGLASTKLTCEGAVAVAEFIAESPRLLRLDLRENEIKTGGLMALSLALKVNHSLLRLDLDREPKKETVKSFIETQKALLAEIQNGCKRNFILAKENEEKEQQMQQSASMPEIAVTTVEEGAVPKSVQPEDNTKTPGKASEELKEPVAEVNKDTEVMVQEENHIQDSDLDTQEEVKGQNESPDLQETQEEGEAQRVNGVQQELPEPEKSQENPGLESGDARSQLGADLEQQPTLEAETSESTPVVCQEGTLPRKNERRISVSSPGRGHKIFVVTRVESPPEQESVKNPPARQDETLPQGSLEERVMAPAPQANEVETQRISNSDPETEGSVGAAVLNSEDCDHLARAGSLPNGLKAEFVLALPEAAAGCDGKFGSCEAEHELNCCKNEKELEEMLLEASQETVQGAL